MPRSPIESQSRDDKFPSLPLEHFADIKPNLTNQWLVKRFLPAHGVALLYGHSGSGKTFLALDIAMHIAIGADMEG